MLPGIDDMQRIALIVAATVTLAGSISCAHKPVKGMVGGAGVSVISLKKLAEFKFPGSGIGYGQPRPFRAENGKDLIVIELKSDKEAKFEKAQVKDDKGQAYESLFSQTFEFQDRPREITILFETPQQIALKTLMLDETAFDLSQVKN